MIDKSAPYVCGARVPRRIWGGTGLSVPVLSFGTQGFGNNFGIVPDEEATALMMRAIALGINHFDCALCYGDSMLKLARALRMIPRDSVVISGRVCMHARRSPLQSGITTAAKARDVVRDVEEQLGLLGINYFDALLIHDPDDVESTLSPNGALDGLLACKDLGLTHWIGYGMEPADFHKKVLQTGKVDVLLHFNDYHLLRQTAAAPGGILDEASKRNIGVMTGWSILRGLLTDADIKDATSRGGLTDPNDLLLAQQLRLWAADNNVSLLAVAIQFCLRDARIHTVPIGSASIAELEANVRAATLPLPKSVWDQLAEWQCTFLSK